MPAKGHWIEQVNKRTRNRKTRVDSANPKHFCLDCTIGSLHYKDNPQDKAEQWKEIDNYFEPAPAPWNWQMLKAGYHIRVKEDFTAGQIIEFEKQGETVQFQPMALEWTNDLDQIQQISMPQDVTPVITNPEVDLLPAVGVPSHQGTIRWNDSYGEGIDFEWRCTSTRLVKILEIENFNKLPTPEQFIIDGGNPALRLNLIFTPLSGVDIYVDGELWDKSAKKQTFKVIEFRKDGEVLWGFMPLRYWGSGEGKENRGQSVAMLEKRGNKFYTSIRVPYEWLQSAVYPVFIDVDVDEVIIAGNDDTEGSYLYLGEYYAWSIDAESIRIYSNAAPETYDYDGVGLRFQAVDVPQGATIVAAHLSGQTISELEDDANCDIYGNDVDDAADFTDETLYARARVAHSTPWIEDGIGFPGYQDSPDISEVIADIVGRAGWVANNAMAFMLIGRTDVTKQLAIYAFESSEGVRAAKLHIEYEPPPPVAAAPWNIAPRVAMMTG